MDRFYYFCSGCSESDSYRAKNCFANKRTKRYEKGEMIAYKGEEVRGLSILLEGEIAVSIVLDSGVALPPKHHKAPYPMGALALFAKESIYRVDVVALEACTVQSVERKSVEQQMVKCARFMRNFIGYTASKFDVITGHLSLLTQRSIKSKIAYYILSRPIGENGEFVLDKSVEELAKYFAVERPSLSRALAQMVEQGVLQYARAKGKVVQMERLKSLLE